MELLTEHARQLLPQAIGQREAVMNIGNSGCAVCCLALDSAEEVGHAMLAAWPGPAPAVVRIVAADNAGAHVVV